MNQLLLYCLLCALAPWLLARLHFVLGALTAPLVYLLAAAQALIVPVMVALDPAISFGSDVYSLGAGVGMILIGGLELVFLLGTGVGLLAALSYLRSKDRAAALAQLDATLTQIDAERVPVAD